MATNLFSNVLKSRVFGFTAVGLVCAGAIALGNPTASHAAGPAGAPKMSEGVSQVEHDKSLFRDDPATKPVEREYDPQAQFEIYGGKLPKEAPRPLIELGRPIYTEGPLTAHSYALGKKNPIAPSLTVYGDLRTAVAYNDKGAAEVAEVAARANVDVDLKLTATERFHAFFRPFDRNGSFLNNEFAGGDKDGSTTPFNLNIETLFFEGDVGAIATGLMDKEAGFDLPIALGFVPLFFQNGIWMDDAIIGGGVSIVGKNSPTLDISNMDFTLFGGFTEGTNPGVLQDDGGIEDEVGIIGAAFYADVAEGYLELGLGHVNDHGDVGDQDHNSFTAAFTKRYGGWLSNSVRGVWTFGQDRDAGRADTADGFAVLVENSLITHLPSTLVPYFNAWAGFDKPQPLAKDTGLLKNVGITFESDGMTGSPIMDDTANNTYGGALGVEYLFALDQQLVVEASALQTMGDDADRNAAGDQYGLGVRYQIPVSDTVILRADGIHAFRRDAEDISGVRFEVRYKF